jgi:hypothetical protein
MNYMLDNSNNSLSLLYEQVTNRKKSTNHQHAC